MRIPRKLKKKCKKHFLYWKQYSNIKSKDLRILKATKTSYTIPKEFI